MAVCPNCAEENQDGVSFCSHCGTALQVNGSQRPERKMRHCPFCAEEIQQAAIVCKYCRRDLVDVGQIRALTQLPVNNPYARPERDANGRIIPAEYPTFFNRDGWSWVAFFFPALWYCHKGMYNAAWKFILVSLIPYVGSLIASIWAGVTGYKDYGDFIEQNDPEVVRASKSTGLGCFIALIAVPIVFYIIMFALMTWAIYLEA